MKRLVLRANPLLVQELADEQKRAQKGNGKSDRKLRWYAVSVDFLPSISSIPKMFNQSNMRPATTHASSNHSNNRQEDVVCSVHGCHILNDPNLAMVLARTGGKP